jgi:Abnormal spindle-like microcephaly-assoc'd, ASPM-SPD-2-Hydin
MLDVLRVLGVVTVALHLVGCSCGVGAAPGPNDNNGVVTFDPVTVGSTQQLQIPFQDSADTDEVIDGATITGPDATAFSVIAKYPIPLPAGTQVSLEIQFAPTHTGTSSATLTLQTQNMGPSPVQLEGTGVAP